jgi:hypothetical protein
VPRIWRAKRYFDPARWEIKVNKGFKLPTVV